MVFDFIIINTEEINDKMDTFLKKEISFKRLKNVYNRNKHVRKWWDLQISFLKWWDIYKKNHSWKLAQKH